MKTLTIARYTIGCLLLSFFLISCTKENDTGINLLPQSDTVGIKVTDTISFSTATQRGTRMRTDEPFYALLGSYSDPVFGKTNASFATAIRLSTSKTAFSSADQVDSMLLYLAYKDTIKINNYYGDYASSLKISIYEITDSLKLINNYYSDSYLSENQLRLIAERTYQAKITDTIFRLRINQQFAEEVMSRLRNDKKSLTNPFKGIYVTAEFITSSGCIMKFNLLNNKSKVRMFYKSVDKPETLDWVISNKDARYNLFSHDYSQSDILKNPNDTLFFIQAGAGLYTHIKIPSLNNMFDTTKRYMITKAELILKNRYPDNDSLRYPSNQYISIKGVRNDSTSYLLEEYNYGGDSLSISYNKAKHEYRFNVTLWLQNVVDRKLSNNGLYIMASLSNSDIARTIFLNNKSKNSSKLIISYFEID